MGPPLSKNGAGRLAIKRVDKAIGPDGRIQGSQLPQFVASILKSKQTVYEPKAYPFEDKLFYCYSVPKKGENAGR